METLRWAALILNVLWVLQELLLFAAPELWSGTMGLMHLVIMFLLLLPFISIFAILLPRHLILTRFALLGNMGSLMLLLFNFVGLNVTDYHPAAFATTAVFLTFLAMIPLTLNSAYLVSILMNRKEVASRSGQAQGDAE